MYKKWGQPGGKPKFWGRGHGLPMPPSVEMPRGCIMTADRWAEKQTERTFHRLVRRADDWQRRPQFSTRPGHELASQHRAGRNGGHGASRRTIQRRQGWRHRDVTGVAGGLDGHRCRVTSSWPSVGRRQRCLMLRLNYTQTHNKPTFITNPSMNQRRVKDGLGRHGLPTCRNPAFPVHY